MSDEEKTTFTAQEIEDIKRRAKQQADEAQSRRMTDPPRMKMLNVQHRMAAQHFEHNKNAGDQMVWEVRKLLNVLREGAAAEGQQFMEDITITIRVSAITEPAHERDD